MSVRELFDLNGKVALITGGSRGLGLQIAEGLGEMGARVCLAARKVDELATAAQHLADRGIEALTFPCDLAKPQAASDLVEQVMRACGQVDILVNNAGANWNAPAEDHPLEAWNKVLNLNLTAPFLLCKAVGKQSMIPRRRGRIINVASVGGLVASDPKYMKTVGYNTTKAGLINFTRTLAAEWGEHNINVNAIAPGFFRSRMTKGLIEQAEEAILDANIIKRFGGPEELKGVAVLLASEASSFITGQVIVVDGGMSAL